MGWQRRIGRLVALVGVFGLAQVCVPPAHAQSRSSAAAAEPSPGQRAFASNCVGCHGLDGSGTERAPSIVRSAKVDHLSDAQIARIISNGVPGTGMPGFRSLNSGQVTALVSYLRALQGKRGDHLLPGDARRGKEIFFGKGECGACHMSYGEGGFWGPDLSGYGSGMRAESVVSAILTPARIPQDGYKGAKATTMQGEQVEGLVRNEDNFSVQILAKDGSFHFLQKSELRSLEHLDGSFMPANYAERLTRSELNDLASYLMSAPASPNTRRVPAESRKSPE